MYVYIYRFVDTHVCILYIIRIIRDCNMKTVDCMSSWSSNCSGTSDTDATDLRGPTQEGVANDVKRCHKPFPKWVVSDCFNHIKHDDKPVDVELPSFVVLLEEAAMPLKLSRVRPNETHRKRIIPLKSHAAAPSKK